jgi:hypothetical protein
MGQQITYGDPDYDAVEFCNYIEPTARKEHRCCETGKLINPGERYYKLTVKHDGRVTSYKRSQWAYDFIRKWIKDPSNVPFQGLAEMMNESIDVYLDEMQIEWLRYTKEIKNTLVQTLEDWHPTINDNVKVSLLLLIKHEDKSHSWKVLVMGGDDFGLENNFYWHQYYKAKLCFDSIVNGGYVRQKDLIKQLFVHA